MALKQNHFLADSRASPKLTRHIADSALRYAEMISNLIRSDISRKNISQVSIPPVLCDPR